MKKLVFIFAAGAVGLMLKTTVVHAQAGAVGTLDHLICYKMQDSFNFPKPAAGGPPMVDMQADLQPEFTQKGCTLLKPVQFCVPATKASVTPSGLNVNPNIIGKPLQDDYICYAAKCPKVGPTAKVVTDQFGLHRERKYQAVTVCVPAVKAPSGCPVGGTNAAACGGVCPDPTQVCKFKRKTKTTPAMCECETASTCTGKPDKFGACGGTCSPVAGQAQQCAPAIDPKTNAPTCECQPFPPPGCSTDPATGTCGGTCPTDPTKKCGLDASGQCTCVNVSQPCGGPVGANGCGGTCDLPGQQCHPDATGICTCASSCGPNPLTGTCGGGCSVAGETCLRDPTTGICTCVPPTNVPCSVNSQNVCTGTCPPGSPAGATCGIDPATGACNCSPAPVPCGPGLVANNCVAGACPPGTTCQVVTGGAAPTCGCK